MSEKSVRIGWSIASLLAFIALPGAAAAQSDGGTLFRQRCQSCHAPGGGPMAPSLAGVVGRKAALTGFSYSAALSKSGLVWTKANLDEYLTAPSKKVPGTRMIVAVPNPEQRAAIIAHLATLK